ncbi:MAG: GNAT family N-acetyltransferase [Gammaproteobacteria bacterium]|nr:GNAT family N-acetyltransferase [Gammaproteobacteria bacterium]MDH3447498.1 GNAT family N-acetyltransferase [Gammaproteobacteria bacterium]
MPAIDINSWISALLEQLQHNRQRQLVALVGPRDWCDARLAALAALDEAIQVLSNRGLLAAAIPFSKADACLGSEARLVVLDLFDGLNPDVLCIAGGLVRAAGVLVVMSPSIEDWDLHADRYACWQDGKRSSTPAFAGYFFDALQTDQQTGIVLTPDSSTHLPPPLPVLQPTIIRNGVTDEQAEILQRTEQWAAANQAGIVLISADRGRGKSTCLGLLVARLQSRFSILVSAKSRQTAAALLRQAPDVEFVAPDRLLQQCPPAELLVIDEAAMIPQPLLRQLTRLYPRIVMATTSGGYEGTGQGFMLRFVADLEGHELLRLRLEKPVRWCDGDRLEAWLGQTLMLNPETGNGDANTEPVAACELQLLTGPGARDSLPLLRQVYALLNSAHYRTRPSDLRMLMENPDLVLILARCQQRVVGVVMLNREGGFELSLCEEIFLGRRRPRGHLLAQMLTAQAGVRHFASYRGLRVQRIAVATAYRRQGLGTRLIERAMQYGRDNSMHYLGASFALDPQTLAFWRQAHFTLVHISYAQGKSSGNHSVVVIRQISRQLDRDIEILQQRIQLHLATWMTQFLQTMDADQVSALLRFAGYDAMAGELEQQEVEAFAGGNKPFELSFASLQKYVMGCIARSSLPPDRLLIEKAVQNRDWKLLERESGAEGRRQLQQRLRRLVEALMKAC